MNNKFPIISAFIFSIIIGLSFMFVKIALSFENQYLILAHRFTVASIPIFLYLIYNPGSLKVSKDELKVIVIISLFYPIIFFTTQIVGLNQTTVSEAGILQATAPALSVILAWLLIREKVRKEQIIGIVLSITGILFIQIMNIKDAPSFNLIGNIWILTSIIATGLYQVLSRKLTRTVSSIIISSYIMIIGTIFFNAMYFIMNGTVENYIIGLTDINYLGAILFLGILSTLVTSMLSIFAVSKLPIVQVSVFNNLATLITILSGIILLEEKVYYYHIIGAIMIVIGVFVVNTISKKDRI